MGIVPENKGDANIRNRFNILTACTLKRHVQNIEIWFLNTPQILLYSFNLFAI